MLKFKLIKLFENRRNIFALAVWQLLCTVLVVFGILPAFMVWVTLVLCAVFILISPCFESVLLLVLTLPFSVSLGLRSADTLTIWRVLFVVLFLVWFIREQKFALRKINFFVWDAYLGLFALAGMLSLVFSKYPMQGLKQLFFWLNIYLFYLVVSNVVKTKEQINSLLKFTVFSLIIIGFLGFIQLVSTFFVSLNDFWQFWVSHVAKIYFGGSFAAVLAYSNSWFAYFNNSQDLRMFSILPDSASFAWLMVLGIGLLLPLTYFCEQIFNLKIFKLHLGKISGKNLYWSLIRFGALAVILSGTRAVWVSMLVPLFLVCVAIKNNFLKTLAKKAVWPYIIILILFLVSPLINQGLRFLRVNKFEENFIQRAKTIYNLKENSNVKRMKIWQQSLAYFLKHPMGAGLGNFAVSQTDFSEYKTRPNYKALGNFHNSVYNLPLKYVSAHNLFFQILVETGFLGLLAFFAFWISFFWQVEKFFRGKLTEFNFYIFLVAQIFLSFVWFLGASLFDVTFFNGMVLIYFFLSLALCGIIIKNYGNLTKN
jgi:O-antigen ligase